jgi:uncharacterized RDD family membrane protein YckC
MTTPGLPHPVADARFYAGVPLRRLLAFFVDTVAILLVGVAATLIVGLFTLGAGFALGPPIIAATALVYRAGALARLSATPGMWLLGIEMRGADGNRVSPIVATFHTLAYTICTILALPQIVSVAMMALGSMGRGLPDAVLGTAVINRPA